MRFLCCFCEISAFSMEIYGKRLSQLFNCLLFLFIFCFVYRPVSIILLFAFMFLCLCWMFWITLFLGDSHGASEPTTRRPFVPPPSGGNAPANPSGGHIYPNVPSAPSAPSVPDNGNRYPGGYDPYGGRPSQPKPNPNPYNPYDGNRDPYGNRDRDPYGNRDPFNDRNKGSSSGGSSTFGDIFNFLRGGSGGSGTRYGTGGSGSNGPSYGDLINALGGGGNRGSGSGISICLSFIHTSKCRIKYCSDINKIKLWFKSKLLLSCKRQYLMHHSTQT